MKASKSDESSARTVECFINDKAVIVDDFEEAFVYVARAAVTRFSSLNFGVPPINPS